ncbi:MAG TPA: 50S ribosomal protein L24 [Candidatus Limnocylindrales bacterium]
MAGPTEHVTRVPSIRKGDTVVVLAGKDAGKRGVVERIIRGRRPPNRGYGASRGRPAISPTAASVVIQGLNIAKRHTKPRQRSTSAGSVGSMPKVDPGGIVEIAQPLDIGKVMLVCPRCDRPTRVGHATLENGRRVRICRHCGEQLEVSEA